MEITVLDWPGNSPDFNPIENLWSIVKNRLRKMDCTTKIKLIEVVIHDWFHEEIKKKLQNLGFIYEKMSKISAREYR